MLVNMNACDLAELQTIEGGLCFTVQQGEDRPLTICIGPILAR